MDHIEFVSWLAVAEPIAGASTIIALALLLFIAVITVVAIRKYPTVDEALKILGVFSGILGVIVGSFGTYFFTRQEVARVEQERDKAVAQAKGVLRYDFKHLATGTNFDGSWILAIKPDKTDTSN